MADADAVERRVRMQDGVKLWTSSSWVAEQDDDAEGRPALGVVHGYPGLWDHLEPVPSYVADVATTTSGATRSSGAATRGAVDHTGAQEPQRVVSKAKSPSTIVTS